MWIKDPKTGEKSVTLTVFMSTFTVAIIKLAFAGIAITDKINFGAFSGSDFAAVITAAGGVYGFRKFTDNRGKEEDK